MTDMANEVAVRLAFAIETAREAGALALRMRQCLAPALAKSAIDYCTEADTAVETLIRNRIQDRFGEPVIGEEFGGEGGAAVWVVDPIDGTTEYIHGTLRWCISLAYVRDGRVEIGVIFAPATDRMFVAFRGGGATLNGQPISVSHLGHGTAPVVEVGWSARRPLARYATLLEGLIHNGMEFRRHGSGALALARSRLRSERRLYRVTHQRVGRLGGPLPRRGGRRVGQRFPAR